MQIFIKIYSVVMKVNHFLPTALTNLPDIYYFRGLKILGHNNNCTWPKNGIVCLYNAVHIQKVIKIEWHTVQTPDNSLIWISVPVLRILMVPSLPSFGIE